MTSALKAHTLAEGGHTKGVVGAQHKTRNPRINPRIGQLNSIVSQSVRVICYKIGKKIAA